MLELSETLNVQLHFDSLKNRKKKKKLYFIACRVLNEIVEGSFFENHESLIILKEFDKHAASSEVAFKFVQTNWPKILTR